MGKTGRGDPYMVVDRLKVGCGLENEEKGAFISLAQCFSLEKSQDSSGIHGNVGKEYFVSAVGIKEEDTPDPDIAVDSQQSIMNKEKLSADADNKGFEPEHRNRIVCFEKDVLKAANDLHIDGKCSSDKVLLQSKVKQKVLFFSQLTRDENCQSGHVTMPCDESKERALNSESTLDVLQVVANESSLEGQVEGRRKNLAIHQTSESIAGKEISSTRRAFWKVPYGGRFQADSSNLGKYSNKSQSAGDFPDDLEDMESPLWLGGLEVECINGNTPELSNESLHDIHIRTEAVQEEGFPQLRRDMNDSVHGKAPSAASDEEMASRRNSLVHYDYGELSFSDSGVLPGRLSYSGHLPYSGSMSMLSDESTTSTGSFAFPILQPEWNCSPVKMAKAERRHYNRHHSRRLRLMCCRF